MEEEEGGGGAVRMSDGKVRVLYRTSRNEGFEGLAIAYGTILAFAISVGRQYYATAQYLSRHNGCLVSEYESYPIVWQGVKFRGSDRTSKNTPIAC